MKTARTFSRLATVASAIAATVGIPTIALSLNRSISEDGIDARRLHEPPYNLQGTKIGIGQVEIGRPAQFGIDKVPDDRGTNPAGVYYRNFPPNIDSDVDYHAHNVAGVMVSSAKAVRGVAPEARLYASAAVTEFGENRQDLECLAAQHVALQNGDDVRAINFSFGEPLWLDPRPNAVLDGNALLTQCIDWSAQEHNVLYVIAGNQGQGGIPIPTDNYNGVNVAFSEAVDGVFRRVNSANLSSTFTGAQSRLTGQEGNIDGRRMLTLLAPGSNVELLNVDNSVTRSSGTSFAAPHVAGTVALIQEYGDRAFREGRDNWSLDSRRHEVTKAVLLNSADKLADPGDGSIQGMTRTVLDKQGKTWLESEAHRDRAIPFHNDMGTGHVNAYRAYQQFSGGQWSPDAPVAAIGWDYNVVEADNYREYIIDDQLQGGSYLTATIAWDRLVELNDRNNNGVFDEGETFDDGGLNDLNIYLMEADETNTANSVWSSESPLDSAEHLFYQIPETGRYKIRVEFANQVNEPMQNYGIAWWGVPVQ